VNEVLKAAQDVQHFCESKGWKFCIIGGLALIRWGEPRETVDVDLTLLTGFGSEEQFITAVLERYEPRVQRATEFALTNRVLLIRCSNGVGIDMALGALPFEETAIERSSMFQFAPDLQLRTCSAEDLIVFKAFASRPKDWIDVDGVIVRNAQRLDWNYIRRQLEPLVELKGAPDILTQLEQKRLAGEQG
jgi:hypothetical protein